MLRKFTFTILIREKERKKIKFNVVENAFENAVEIRSTLF